MLVINMIVCTLQKSELENSFLIHLCVHGFRATLKPRTDFSVILWPMTKKNWVYLVFNQFLIFYFLNVVCIPYLLFFSLEVPDLFISWIISLQCLQYFQMKPGRIPPTFRTSEWHQLMVAESLMLQITMHQLSG